MNAAVLDVLVPHNPATLARVGALPDPDDTHVVATAIDAGASVIVTFNLRDFPAKVLEPLGLTAVHPDAFVSEVWASSPDTVLSVLRAQAADLRNPPCTIEDVRDALSRCGLTRFAELWRAER